MKLKVFLAICLLLCGCKSATEYNAKLNKWVGKSQYELLNAWGKPNGIFKLGQKDKIITYTRENTDFQRYGSSIYNPDFNDMNTAYMPFSYNEDFATENVSYHSGYIKNSVCQTSFYIKDGVVSSCQWRGNNCRL